MCTRGLSITLPIQLSYFHSLLLLLLLYPFAIGMVSRPDNTVHVPLFYIPADKLKNVLGEFPCQYWCTMQKLFLT